MKECSISFTSLDFFHPGPGLRFAIDRTSHVSLLRFGMTAISPKYVLIEPSSLAIWNRNKVIVCMAVSVWTVNLALLLAGEFSPLSIL